MAAYWLHRLTKSVGCGEAGELNNKFIERSALNMAEIDWKSFAQNVAEMRKSTAQLNNK